MQVTVVGMGPGAAVMLTEAANAALREAELFIGAQRLLDELQTTRTRQHRIAATRPQEIIALLRECEAEKVCILVSGDSGFYSNTRILFPLLNDAGFQVAILPGISSVQYFAAKIGKPWQDWKLVSAHGVNCDPVTALCEGSPVFFLTGGAMGPDRLCASLCDAGLGTLSVTVGENLSYSEEQIYHATAQTIAAQSFAPLSVLLVEAVPRIRRTPGIPDGAFLRDRTPMTKQEVRAAILAKLAIQPQDICWDVGAGTGSVSVELALQCACVYAVEREASACELIRKNREKFGAWNLQIVASSAPEALAQLPQPTAVFVGGSGGKLPAILQKIYASNPAARVCVSAIALESLQTALQTMVELGYRTEVVQIGVSRTTDTGNLHLLLAQNPVFLITGVLE
ncbi:MAG: precorrin-6y C5,15-methyltransferase (decarboxylating) subunit CbiE [Oscillospiraceae bacterium]|jgi:precorrin-6Y C5,15-methyltransferase (decarboxylating)